MVKLQNETTGKEGELKKRNETFFFFSCIKRQEEQANTASIPAPSTALANILPHLSIFINSLNSKITLISPPLGDQEVNKWQIN